MHKSDPIQVDRQNKSKSFLHMAFIPSIRTLSLVAFFAVGLLMNGDIKPMIRRGFYCDDSSIKYPYKQDTIDIKVLMFVALVVPGLLISICDRVLGRQVRNLMLTDKTKFSRKRRKVSDDGQLNGIEEAGEEEHELIRDQESVKRRHLQGNGVYSNCSDIQDEIGDRVALAQDESGEESDLEAFSRVPLDAKGEQQSNRSDRYLPRVSRLSVAHFSEFQLFFFGISVTMLFTGIGKIVCGRFRPHFLQRCQPDVDCTSKANTNRYIEDFACTNNNLRSRDFSYITTSWPSGKCHCSERRLGGNYAGILTRRLEIDL